MDPKKTFALDVRVLLCRNCGAPLEAKTHGGDIHCDYCDSVNHVAPRPELKKVQPAAQQQAQVPSGVAEQQRVATLHTQAASYNPSNNPYAFYRAPPGLESFQVKVVKKGFSDPGLAQEVQTRFIQAAAECEANPHDPMAQRRCFWLARVLSQIWSAQDQFFRQRAVLEMASEVLTDEGHRYIMRTSLSSAARSEGDLSSADDWLAQCDPAPALLDLDSAYRVTAATLALVRQKWGDALRLVGPGEGEIPFEPSSILLASMIRTAALEGAGNGAGAETLLRSAVAKHGRKDVAHLLEVNDSVAKARQTFDRLQSQNALPRGPSKAGGLKIKGCLSSLFVLALIVLPIVFSPLICTGMGSCVGYHQVAMNRLRACPQAVQALGTPIKASSYGFSCGNMETSGNSGNASWRMPVQGSRASGVYNFNATMSGGQWTVNSGQVTVNGQTIDLNNCSAPTNVQTFPGVPGVQVQTQPVYPQPGVPQTPTVGTNCARLRVCCAAASGNNRTRAICRSAPQLQALGARGEPSCGQLLNSVRTVLRASNVGVPPQCQ